MKKSFLILTIVLVVIAGAGLVMANKASSSDVPCITVSPKTLVLSSSGTVFTVHSNIPYGSVVTESLTLDGIEATYTKADDCGDLVVKFDREDIKGIVAPGAATLTLSGLLSDGTEFSASDTITVKK